MHELMNIGKLGVLLVAFLALAMAAEAAVQELTYDSFNDATNITYDSLNRVLVKNFSNGQSNYTYDVDYQGTLANVTFPNGSISYEYDDKLRVVKEARIIDGLRFEKLIDYDSADRAVRQAGSPGTVTGYAYGTQGLVDRIVGFVNETRHNAFGSVTNRTYSSGKVTNFTYDRRNSRLARINTDSVQNLLFEYDSVGNIVMINDTANSRQQVMTYDHLDRLLNMSLNGGQSFVYRYDALGNLLKITRGSASDTILVYGGTPTHAPSRIITGNANVDVIGFTLLNNSNRSKAVEFRILNDRNGSAATVNFTVSFGDDSFSNSTINFNAGANNESVFVFAGHEYAAGGSYGINVTAGNLGSPSDYKSRNTKFGIHIDKIEVTSRNITNVSYRFNIKNDIANSASGVSWQCNNGLSASGITVNGLSNKTIEEVYNYSSAGVKELNCSVSSTEGSDSIKTAIEIKGIEIDGYNRTFSDGNTTLIRFNVTNQFYPRAVDWRITSDGQTFTGTTASVATNASTMVSQEINYTTPGKKTVEVNITAGSNLSDSISDIFVLKGLEIDEYNLTNITLKRRLFTFLIKNYWPATLGVNWNLTEPSRTDSATLDSEQSIQTSFEADYDAQGGRKPVLNVYNGSTVKSVFEIFTNKLVKIADYETITEDKSGSVTEAFIRSNNASYNVSWTFHTGEATVTGSNFTAINATEDFMLIIGSSYANSSVYNASLFINSSSFNDSASGVIIT